MNELRSKIITLWKHNIQTQFYYPEQLHKHITQPSSNFAMNVVVVHVLLLIE